ncbi:MAG: chitobiase/beta-hexosaminidase C-terminal domain-containing protein, partial [Silvibacterium sp.]
PGTCSPSPYLVSGISSFPLTLTFTPAKVGERSAVLTATNTATLSSGTATAFGVGQGAMVTLDQGNTPTAYTGFTSPAGISVSASGNLFVADTGASTVDEIAAGTTTLTSIGSGFSSPTGTALDANGNLYIADTGNNRIVEIAQPGGASTQTTLVSSSTKFDGTALSGPTGLAIGPDGVLYIADNGNSRVVTYNPANGLTGVRASGLSNPQGIAVDAAGSLYVANEGVGGSGSSVQVYSGDGVVTTLTPSGVTAPVGIAVDASGSLLIADQPTGNIVRVPNNAGTLTSADATVVEKNPQSGAGLALDAAGNLYTTDPDGGTAYAIQRTASTVNFGTVNDGASSSEVTIDAENAGNMSLALASGMSSFLTPPTSTLFTLAAGSPVDCTTATSIASGTACEFVAQFSPALGTATGTQSATADFNSTALNTASAPITLTGSAVYQPLLSQTINFTAPPSPVAYGSGPITLSATATSGLPVTFSVLSGPGSVSGDALTITGVGTIVVAANQAGNADYTAAPQVTQSVVVTQASQTINFTAPPSPVTYGSGPITLSATATSGLPVTFSLVSGPGSVSGNTLTITGVGTIVVAANQAGNADYAAAPQVTQSVVVNVIGAVAAPTFTPAAGSYSSVQSVTLADTTAGAMIYYTTDGSAPTTSSTLYSGAITVSSTETINAIAVAADYSNSPIASAVYTISLISPSFSISIAPSSLNVTAGGSAQTTVSVTPQGGFNSAISFSCSGLPAGATCSFSPATVTPSGASTSTTQLTIATTSASAALHRESSPWFPGGTVLACALFGFLGFRKRRGLQWMLLLVVGITGFSLVTGCGVSTPPRSTTVTVTGTSGSLQSSATFTLTVKQ